jgi:hypothetical protein
MPVTAAAYADAEHAEKLGGERKGVESRRKSNGEWPNGERGTIEVT